jgi:predicted RNA binding protein YcfA (HicA-like mRNA interferase family)
VKKDWTLRSVTGIHHIYTKAGNPARISIPIHRNKDLKVGLIRHIMKIAGISEDEL